jgi:hypothetical protein
MKKIIILTALIVAGYFGYKLFSGARIAALLEPQITISDLRNNPNVFADSLVELQGVTVESSESVLNYSKCSISDPEGQKILLLSCKPYRKGQIINVRGRFLQVYHRDEKNFDAFVAQDLKPLNGFIKILKMAVGI